ncbi:hypothetical protein EXW96_00250 [Paenibacillus sp. JMULE4]|jgi:hypothetical protein|uniref:hypothetical protein n=1 Tax=Paenibacillus sp. JMULE4 TaxID=2518342 RepID=UPI0015767E67|nr:hypothetical protein [Paenibacillus sp. JMULE4]NTZ16072.1 hypothetical protein [Paenibacillus sp. JMULE4]
MKNFMCGVWNRIPYRHCYAAHLLHLSFDCFLYLTRFPEVEWKAAVHIAKWVLIYIGVEWVGYRFGYITYSHGWNCWWSLFFDVHMFLMLRFHHTKRVWSIPMTILSIFFYLIMFGYL